MWGCAITGSVPVEWILQRIMLRILAIILAWTSGEEDWISAPRWQNTSGNALLTTWSRFVVSHLHCAQPLWPNSVWTLNWPQVQGDWQWRMAVAVRVMNVRLMFSINDVSFVPICCMPQKCIRWIWSTISVTANRNLNIQFSRHDNGWTRREQRTSVTNICGACNPGLVQLLGYQF